MDESFSLIYICLCTTLHNEANIVFTGCTPHISILFHGNMLFIWCICISCLFHVKNLNTYCKRFDGKKLFISHLAKSEAAFLLFTCPLDAE